MLKDIKYYENKYAVSTNGNIWSYPKNSGGDGSHDGKFLKKLIGRGGYYVIGLYKDKLKLHYIHRLVAETFIPNPENKPCVNHKNGIKTDNRIENLEWVTYKENNNHAYVTGLRKYTDSQRNNWKKAVNSNIKINKDKILKIKKLYKNGIKQKIIAKIFNVDQSHISKIINNKRGIYVSNPRL